MIRGVFTPRNEAGIFLSSIKKKAYRRDKYRRPAVKEVKPHHIQMQELADAILQLKQKAKVLAESVVLQRGKLKTRLMAELRRAQKRVDELEARSRRLRGGSWRRQLSGARGEFL